MTRKVPNKLLSFLKTALDDVDDGYEYTSELNRILNSDDCQLVLLTKEIEALREYAEDVKRVGEINYYAIEKIREIEKEHFGAEGILGYLKVDQGQPGKPVWPF
jgi:hypothetical protein